MALTEEQKRNAEKNRKYWEDREKQQHKKAKTDAKAYDKKIKQIYDDMLEACQKEIEAFYGKYASKEGITLAEAKKRVSQIDIERYEKKAKRYVKEKDFSAEANEEMRLYNLAMKVNRLEMLKANIGLELIAGHDEIQKFMSEILQGRTEDELKRQAGILGKTIRNNAKLAHTIPYASFHNAKFSDRIWMYQDLLKADLEKLLSTALIQGKNPRVVAKELEKRFGVRTSDAQRLMRTELCRVQTEAQRKSYIANGFIKYRFIVNGTGCPICKEIAKKNGGVYMVKDMIPGLNAPPMHPHCMCSTAAYEDSAEYEAWLDYLSKGGTTEEWEKLKIKKLNKGLSAKIGGDEVPLHEEPVQMGNVDYSNKEEVYKELQSFEKNAIKEKIETAYVVTTKGEVFKCFGIEDRVFPDYDLKDKLKGASVSHNHPIEETTYTFSTADLSLFMEYDLEVLRGCDEKYTYELTRDSANIDDFPEEWTNEENYGHCTIIDLASKYKIGYRRWANE